MPDLGDIILACVPKSRFITSAELWDKYRAACKRYRVLPLYGQCAKAVCRMLREGRLVYDSASKSVKKRD